MAYNLLSGTVVASQEYLPGDLIVENLVSGSFKGDGSNISFVPRVSNAADNNLITNVGGDANTLTCESNLTFDGSLLTVTGDVTASSGISASYFMGDGAGLINIPAGEIVAEGPVYSVQFHNSDGDLSGSSILKLQNSTLKVTCGLQLNRATASAHLTASVDDYYIGVDSSAGAVDIRLPDAASLDSGHTYVIKDEGGAANTNNITIKPSSSLTYFNNKAVDYPNSGTPGVQVGGTNAPTSAELFELDIISISAWVKLDSAGAGTRAIFSCGGTTAPRTFVVRSNDKLRFETRWSDTVSSGGPHNHYWETNETLTDSTWTHVALVYDGSDSTNNPTFYINATASTIGDEYSPEPSGSLVAFSAGDKSHIGNLAGSQAANRFEGDMDEVAIWNVALTSDNINTLYNSGSGPTNLTASGSPQSGSLYSWWRMGDDTNDAIDGTGTYSIGVNSIVDQLARANGNPHADMTTSLVTDVLSGPVTDPGQTIDGQISAVLESPYAAIQLYCNGSDKFFIC